MTNHAKVGGILSIVSGAFGVLGLGWVALWNFIIGYATGSIASPGMLYNFGPAEEEALQAMVVLSIVFGVGYFLVGVLGVIGGVFALRRRLWGLALTGAIAGTLVFFPIGIPAIIFTVLGKPEFEPQVGRAE